MSMPFTAISCSKCADSWNSTVLWGAFKYTLADGSSLSINRTLGWCVECASFSATEVIPTRHSLETQIYELTQKRSALIDKAHRSLVFLVTRKLGKREMSSIASLDQSLRDYERLLAWRDARRSPPKCLTCGGNEVHHVGTIGNAPSPHRLPFSHPGCGGELSVSVPAIRINMNLREHIYDAEGCLIEVREPTSDRERIRRMSKFLDD